MISGFHGAIKLDKIAPLIRYFRCASCRMLNIAVLIRMYLPDRPTAMLERNTTDRRHTPMNKRKQSSVYEDLSLTR